MRSVKIFFLTIAILFIDTLLLFQVFSAFSKWSLKTKLFSVTRIRDLPIENIKTYKKPGKKSEFLIGRLSANVSYPDSNRLIFFSPFTPFRKTTSQISFDKDMLIPMGRSFSTLQKISNCNNGEPVVAMLGVENKKIVLELRDIEETFVNKQKLEDLSIPIPKGNMTVRIVAIEDIDGDLREELVWDISAEFAGLPRGIAAHDPLSGKKKWEFLCAGIPVDVIVKDIDYDGKKEIIFSIWASHNNKFYNDMNDDTSYVGILDCLGNVKWCKIAGRTFTMIGLAVEDLEQDGNFEVITARSCHRAGFHEPGQIKIYDAKTGEPLNDVNYPGVSFRNLHVVNMNDDPYMEIVANDISRGLWMWNHELKMCSNYKSENTNIKILGVGKVEKSSFPIIFTWYSYNTLRIFDNRLNPIFDFQFPSDMTNVQNSIVPVSDGDKTSFILTTDRTYMVSTKHTNAFQDYLLLVRSRFFLYLLGIIVFNGLLYIGWRQRKKLNVRALALIRESSKTSPEWIVKTQEVLHKMKSPLTSILWETEKIDGLIEKKRQSKTFFSKLKEINNAILADVNEMKLMNHFLMKYLQVQTLQFKSIETRTAIAELVEKYRSSFNKKFTFPCRFSDTLPPLLADEDQLKEALSIVIDNAIDAVPEGGTISITAEYHKILPNKKQENIVCVTIEDNGCGIPEDKRDKIFEPYFTTKEGGIGIGLAIAKRIIESHDGWIEVESKEKIGTKFALYFPVKTLT